MIANRYFEPGSSFWDSWTRTEPDFLDNELALGNDLKRFTEGKRKLNQAKPGFSSAFEKLTRLGCDRYFATYVLKFAIVHAQNENLTVFLERSRLLTSVETALAIGLTGEEFVTSLEMYNTAAAGSKEPPSDMCFASSARCHGSDG